MGNGQVSRLVDEDAELTTAGASGKAKRLSGLPNYIRKPVVLSSKTAARMRPTEWMLFDAVVATGALTVGYTMTPRAHGLLPPAFAIVVLSLAVAAGGNIAGLYERQSVLSRIKLFQSLCLTTAIGIASLALFANIVVFQQIGRWVLLITSITFICAAGIPRLAGGYAAHLYKLRVLLVGDKSTASPVAGRLAGGKGHHVLVGYCGDDGARNGEALGTVGDIPRICSGLKIDEIVITRSYMDRPHLLETCFDAVQAGCRVLDEASFYEEVFEEVPVQEINEGWFYAAKLGGASPFSTALKRTLDIAVASVVLVLASPLFLLLWMLVRLTSRGPAIYSQRRCGQYGRPFQIYKFRSMFVDAETGGAQWAEERDPRVTPLGRFLRRTRLDEIPQFWNVLRGDMSFVGPRPERPELASEIQHSVAYFAFRNLVRPGITGLAQIRYGYGSSVDDARRKLQHDLYYIKNWSLLLDLQIILRTLSAVMKGSR